MKKTVWATPLLLGAVAFVVLMLFPNLSFASSMNVSAAELIASFEGFSAAPYWDVSRWSWGYGTEAPGRTGTITKEEALAALQAYVDDSYAYLSPLIYRQLTNNQWAALLSFAYNEGNGNADNLVDNINDGNDTALEAQWKLYNKSRDENGALQYNSNLASRRAREWQVWQS